MKACTCMLKSNVWNETVHTKIYTNKKKCCKEVTIEKKKQKQKHTTKLTKHIYVTNQTNRRRLYVIHVNGIRSN